MCSQWDRDQDDLAENNVRFAFADGESRHVLSTVTVVGAIATGSSTTPTRPLARHTMSSPTVRTTGDSSRNGLGRVASRALWSTICLALLFPQVNAQNSGTTLKFDTPSELSICTPTNLTWSGGTPPYIMNIKPFDPSTNAAMPSLNQRFRNINVSWLMWTPNFTTGTTIQFSLSDFSLPEQMAEVHQTITPGTDTGSCLQSTSTLQSTASTSFETASQSVVVAPSPFVNPGPIQAFGGHSGLGVGAIVGIAVGVAAVAILVTTFLVWWVLRRRSRGRYADFDVDRPAAASPTFSDSSTAYMNERRSGISATLASIRSPKAKVNAVNDACVSPTESHFGAYSGPASPASIEAEVGFHPTPYIPHSERESPANSLSDVRRSRKSARDTVASTNVSTTDVRSSTPSTQISEWAGSASSPLRSPRVVQFETDAGVRLAVGPVEEEPGMATHEVDVLSDAGTHITNNTIPPPPYQQYEDSQSIGVHLGPS